MKLLVTLQPFTAVPFLSLGELKHRIQTFVDAGGICIWFACCSFTSLQYWRGVGGVAEEGLLDIVTGTLLLYSFKLCGHTTILLCNFSVGLTC